MTVNELTQYVEIRIWNLVIALIEQANPLMKVIQSSNQQRLAKNVLFLRLLIVWAAVGFVTGLIIGRIIWMMQLM